MIRLALAAALLLAATLAFAQRWSSDQMGGTTYYRSDNGWHGSSDQMGNTTYSTFYGPNGQVKRCSSDQMGGTTYTNCN